jgi:hypothetical protein
VKKVLRGQRREETSRFIAFRSHWRYASEFCTAGEGHEKRGVEGEVGYFRRNHSVPVPEAVNLKALNGQLLNACRQDEGRRIAGREQNIGADMIVEREHLLPLAAEGMDSGANRVSDRQQSGLRPGSDQRVFSSVEGRYPGAFEGLCQHCRAVA